MTSFSFGWFFTLFMLQVMSLGINMGKLGEVLSTLNTLKEKRRSI